MEYQVVKRDDSFYIVGMKCDYSGIGIADEDTLLICKYEAGDCDTNFSHRDQIHSALYDEYQTNDQLHEGDTFVTPFGRFKCVSFHVVPDEETNA